MSVKLLARMRARSQVQQSSVRVERQQPFLGQRGDKLDREEGIAGGFFLNQLRQGPAARQLAAQSVGDEPADIVERERCERDLVNLSSGFADRLERPQKRVRGDDLVVSIGPDQKQVPHLRVHDQVL